MSISILPAFLCPPRQPPLGLTEVHLCWCLCACACVAVGCQATLSRTEEELAGSKAEANAAKAQLSRLSKDLTRAHGRMQQTQALLMTVREQKQLLEVRSGNSTVGCAMHACAPVLHTMHAARCRCTSSLHSPLTCVLFVLTSGRAGKAAKLGRRRPATRPRRCRHPTCRPAKWRTAQPQSHGRAAASTGGSESGP